MAEPDAQAQQMNPVVKIEIEFNVLTNQVQIQAPLGPVVLLGIFDYSHGPARLATARPAGFGSARQDPAKIKLN